jgi:DNA-binding transcriptional regulator YdaS (Cro superfamily)
VGVSDSRQKTLLKACMIAGDEAALAARLGLPVGEVVNHLLGDKQVPTETFLKAVDIVLGHTGAEVREARKFLDALKRRHRPR